MARDKVKCVDFETILWVLIINHEPLESKFLLKPNMLCEFFLTQTPKSHQWPSGSALEIVRREVPASTVVRACQLFGVFSGFLRNLGKYGLEFLRKTSMDGIPSLVQVTTCGHWPYPRRHTTQQNLPKFVLYIKTRSNSLRRLLVTFLSSSGHAQSWTTNHILLLLFTNSR